jgi:hypothetical protein
MMVNFPEHVFFSGDSVPVELASVHAHDPEILNAAKIREATGSLRELDRKLQILSERKKALGY